MFSCEFCQSFKNIFFFYRAPPVAAFVDETYFSDCNGIRTHNHLVHKQTVNDLSKLTKQVRCSHLILRYRYCFEQGVPWNLGNYRVYIHSAMCMWHDKNTQAYYSVYTIYCFPLGETNLISWSTGATDPILREKKITIFWLISFFNLFFLRVFFCVFGQNL